MKETAVAHELNSWMLQFSVPHRQNSCLCGCWINFQQKGVYPDLVATSGDYLRVWRVSDSDVRLECLLNNVRQWSHLDFKILYQYIVPTILTMRCKIWVSYNPWYQCLAPRHFHTSISCQILSGSASKTVIAESIWRWLKLKPCWCTI